MKWPFRKPRRESIDPADRWFVELDGQAVAMIANPADDDNFWFTWDILPLDGIVIPQDLWDYATDGRRSFLHVTTNERNFHTIPAGQGAVLPNGRVLLRGPLRNSS